MICPFHHDLSLFRLGPVNITDITVDGTGGNLNCSQSPFIWLAGIFYTSGSSGTVNKVTTRNHLDQGCGAGVWAESAGPSQTVNVTNSSIHDFDFAGIFAGTIGYDGSLTVAIESNSVNGQKEVAQYGAAGINTSFVSATVSSNTVTGGSVGLFSLSSAPVSTIIRNNIGDVNTGIFIDYDFGIVKSNRISNTSTAINLLSNDAVASNNLIYHSGVAFEINCDNVSLTKNDISDVVTALDNIPASLTSVNSYLNVDTIRINGVCP